jgi:hypothetical protein
MSHFYDSNSWRRFQQITSSKLALYINPKPNPQSSHMFDAPTIT